MVLFNSGLTNSNTNRCNQIMETIEYYIAAVDGHCVPLVDAVFTSVGFISGIRLKESTQKPFEPGQTLQEKHTNGDAMWQRKADKLDFFHCQSSLFVLQLHQLNKVVMKLLLFFVALTISSTCLFLKAMATSNQLKTIPTGASRNGSVRILPTLNLSERPLNAMGTTLRPCKTSRTNTSIYGNWSWQNDLARIEQKWSVGVGSFSLTWVTVTTN